MTTPHCARAHLGLLTVATALLSACACAQPKGNDRPPTPPVEALAACNTAAAGAPCNFSSPQGTVSGNCWAPVGKPLACKPTHPPAAAPARQGAVTKP
jgi:hypothetical protein